MKNKYKEKQNKNRGREEEKKIIFNLIMVFLNSDKLCIFLCYEMRSQCGGVIDII